MRTTAGSIRAVMRVAPLSVAGLLRGRLFEQSTAVLTSATLTVGGGFDAMAAAWGLTGGDDAAGSGAASTSDRRSSTRKPGILYVAAHLPPPGRDGTGSAEQLDEIDGADRRRGRSHTWPVLVDAGGRAAAEIMRERLVTPVLCQGDDTTSALVETVRRRPVDVAVRHAVAVAGRRRARPVAVAGAHRPHPVPAARRSAADRAAARRRRPRRQRVHGRRRQPRRAPAGPGRGPAAASRPTTAAWWRCWTRGWPPPATAAICARRCRRSGPPPTRPGSGMRWSGSATQTPHYPDGAILGADLGHLTTRKGAAHEPTTRRPCARRRRRRAAGGVLLDNGGRQPRSRSSTIRSAWPGMPAVDGPTGLRPDAKEPIARRRGQRRRRDRRTRRVTRSAISRTSGRRRTARRSTAALHPGQGADLVGCQRVRAARSSATTTPTAW